MFQDIITVVRESARLGEDNLPRLTGWPDLEDGAVASTFGGRPWDSPDGSRWYMARLRFQEGAALPPGLKFTDATEIRLTKPGLATRYGLDPVQVQTRPAQGGNPAEFLTLEPGIPTFA